jgi:hypothetical protein
MIMSVQFKTRSSSVESVQVEISPGELIDKITISTSGSSPVPAPFIKLTTGGLN